MYSKLVFRSRFSSCDKRLPVGHQELHVPHLRVIDGGVIDLVQNSVRAREPDAARRRIGRPHRILHARSPARLQARARQRPRPAAQATGTRADRSSLPFLSAMEISDITSVRTVCHCHFRRSLRTLVCISRAEIRGAHLSRRWPTEWGGAYLLRAAGGISEISRELANSRSREAAPTC